MKLLINAESLRPPLTGIGNYTFNLLDTLQQLQQIERIDCFSGRHFSTVQATLSNCIDACSASYAERGAQTHSAVANRLRERLRQSSLAYRARELMRNSAMLAGTLRRRDYLYHEPSFILKAHSGPCIATIHDLSFIRYPQFHPPQRVEWLIRQLPRTLARADAIITDSEYVRHELIGEFGLDPSKVTAIALGAADRYRPQDSSETRQTMERYGLRHGGYLLFVGTLEPRKGLDTLLDAWSMLPPAMQQAYPLVLAGAPGWNNQALRERIDRLLAKGGLKHLSFVDEHSLPALYSGAAIFVSPSLYEGFGLPLLEAMRCGAATLCTANTSMAEFAGGGTQLFAGGDACQLAERIQQLVERPAERQKLAQAGLLHSQQFSWTRCARRTCEVYASLSRP